MKSFSIQKPDYFIRTLRPDHQESVQTLLVKCSDYYLLVDGETCSPIAAEKLYNATPPGKSLKEKFLYGIWQKTGEIIGVLEGMRNYPTESVWWIALFMLNPTLRGQGLGREIIEGFIEFTRVDNGKTIMLGVVEDNKSALFFWEKLGFNIVRQTEPR